MSIDRKWFPLSAACWLEWSKHVIIGQYRQIWSREDSSHWQLSSKQKLIEAWHTKSNDYHYKMNRKLDNYLYFAISFCKYSDKSFESAFVCFGPMTSFETMNMFTWLIFGLGAQQTDVKRIVVEDLFRTLLHIIDFCQFSPRHQASWSGTLSFASKWSRIAWNISKTISTG